MDGKKFLFSAGCQDGGAWICANYVLDKGLCDHKVSANGEKKMGYEWCPKGCDKCPGWFTGGT